MQLLPKDVWWLILRKVIYAEFNTKFRYPEIDRNIRYTVPMFLKNLSLVCKDFRDILKSKCTKGEFIGGTFKFKSNVFD